MNSLSLPLDLAKRHFDWSVEPLDLCADWPQLDRMLEAEGWPFTRDDIAMSVAQPGSAAMVARHHHKALGFILAHHFGPVASGDMIMVDHGQRAGHPMLSVDLWLQLENTLEQRGFRTIVAHGTRRSSRAFGLFGFQPGRPFTALRREPLAARSDAALPDTLGPADLPALTRLDAEVFGIERDAWVRSLCALPNARQVGRHDQGELVASICLRERRHQILFLDACNALSFAALRPLLDQVLAACSQRALECMAAVGSDLHHYLLEQRFFVPAAFAAIAPLVELRSGPHSDIGLGDQVRTLNWV